MHATMLITAFLAECAQAQSTTTCGSDYGAVADDLLGSLDLYNGFGAVTSSLSAGTGSPSTDYIMFVTTKVSF